MPLSNNLRRIISTLVDMLHTRLELASVELEEEFARLASYLIYALIAFFCGGVAVVLLVVLLIAILWDEHRIAVILSLIGVFGVTSAGLSIWVRQQFLNKPRLLEQSIAEFRKDAALISPLSSETENEPD